jgi:hypothetical protein
MYSLKGEYNRRRKEYATVEEDNNVRSYECSVEMLTACKEHNNIVVNKLKVVHGIIIEEDVFYQILDYKFII